MIWIDRKECPVELTQAIREELTIKFINNEEDVWNDTRIKKPIKDALLRMSNNKCAYCECIIEREGNYFTVEHFFPKSDAKFKVLAWENLLPACGRCNGAKSGAVDKIIDPSKERPNDYMVYDGEQLIYAIIAKDGSKLGKDTKRILGLNVPTLRINRMEVGEKAKETCNKLCKSILKSINSKVKDGKSPVLHYSHRYSFLELLMMCNDDKSYSAVVATAITKLEIFDVTVKRMKDYEIWNSMFDEPYKCMLSKKYDWN